MTFIFFVVVVVRNVSGDPRNTTIYRQFVSTFSFSVVALDKSTEVGRTAQL